MKIAIENIVGIGQALKITANQSLFLLAFREGIYTVDLPGEELIDLINQGFLKGNQVTLEGQQRLEEAWNVVVEKKEEEIKLNSAYPILTKDTGNLVKVLAKHFHRGHLTAKEYERLSVFNKNPIAIPFLFMFLQMFPTSDPIKNAAWARHFGENSSGVTLRRLTRGTARKFQDIWKKKDIGLFLLGTYLCIKQSYNSESNRYFVKKIENYLAEWEYWYQLAEDMLNSGQLEEYTKAPKAKVEGNNTSVI